MSSQVDRVGSGQYFVCDQRVGCDGFRNLAGQLWSGGHLCVILTAADIPGIPVAKMSDNDLPEKTDHNERRNQRRFVCVLDYESVAIETPRRDALLFHSLVLFATIRQQSIKCC